MGSRIVECLRSLLDYVDAAGVEASLEEDNDALMEATLLVLEASSRHFSHVYEGALQAWSSCESSSTLLQSFVEEFKVRLEPGADDRHGEQTELAVQSLAALFIAQPSRMVAFQLLVRKGEGKEVGR